MTDVTVHIIGLAAAAIVGSVAGAVGVLLTQHFDRSRRRPPAARVVTPRAYHLDAPTQILPPVRDPNATAVIYPSACLWPGQDHTAQYPHINGGPR